MNASLLREYFKVAEFSRLRCCVLIFDVVPRSRSSGGERPPHTRKVTGSIPVGTTRNLWSSRRCRRSIGPKRVIVLPLLRLYCRRSDRRGRTEGTRVVLAGPGWNEVGGP